MILPRGELLHKNLSTAYTDLPALLSTLKAGNFSGVIEIDFPENKGVVFIDSGEIINAEAKIGPDAKRIIGQEAIQNLLTFSNQKDGVINIYRLLPEQVAMAVGNLQHEILFKGLTTDFTRLDRLLLKLREEKHSGFIEVLTKDHQAMGVLYLERGEPVEVITVQELGSSTLSGKSIPSFVENIVKQGAIFNVYKSQGRILRKETKEIKERKAQEQGEDQKELLPIFQEILSQAGKLIDGISRKGVFDRTFIESLIERSEEFPFLDPFAGEFEYGNGILRFTGETRKEDFARGIAECFRTTLTRFEKELTKEKMVSLKLKAGIESILEHHRETLKRLEIEDLISSLIR